jgi:hypothetical protein
MPARLSVIVPLSGLAKVRRAKVPPCRWSARCRTIRDIQPSCLKTGLPTVQVAPKPESRADGRKAKGAEQFGGGSALILVLGGRYDAGNE